MDSGALAPAAGRGLQAEIRDSWASRQYMQLWGVRGATPCHSEHLQGPVCTPHPEHQPEQRPEESSGSCGRWWAVRPQACSASVLKSSSSSFKASHLKSVSRHLDPSGASHVSHECTPPPQASGAGSQPWQLSGVLPAPGQGPAPVTCPWCPASAPRLHLLRRLPESCWGQHAHPASPSPDRRLLL